MKLFIMPICGYIDTDTRLSQCFPSARRIHRNKENHAKKHRVMEYVTDRCTPSRIFALPTIHGKSAVLLPRNQSPALRSRRSFSRLNEVRSRVSQTTSPPHSEVRQRKLVLHFDARNTVLVADSVTQIGVKEAFNSYLTGVTWGNEEPNGTWKWVSDKPSLTAPSPGSMTYYKHMEAQLVRIPSDRGSLRKKTGDFTQEELGERFNPYLEKGLSNIKWTHPTDVDQLIMTDKDGEKYHYLLPSVFQLIQYLQDANRDFSIVIRTYGMDAPNILRTLSTSLQGNHPDFPNLKHLPVCHTIGKIARNDDGISVQADFLKLSKKPIRDEREIYERLSGTKGVCAFVDDFPHWQNNNYHHAASKPHWVDLEDTDVQHIFFDDNLRVTDTDSIVDLRLFKNGTDKPRSIHDLEELQRFEDACLVQADLLESTGDLNYFVNKVKKCEENYDRLIAESLQS